MKKYEFIKNLKTFGGIIGLGVFMWYGLKFGDYVGQTEERRFHKIKEVHKIDSVYKSKQDSLLRDYNFKKDSLQIDYQMKLNQLEKELK